MPFSRILNRVLSYTEYGPEYHIDNQKVTKRPAVVDKIQQNDKTSLCLWYSNESNAEQYYLNSPPPRRRSTRRGSVGKNNKIPINHKNKEFFFHLPLRPLGTPPS